MDKLSVSVPRAADTLDVSRAKVYELLRDGELTGRKIDGRTVIAVSELQAFLDRAPLYRPRSKREAA